MKRILFLALLLVTSLAFAQEPIITQNVTVLQNTTAAQCPSSWRGTTQPANQITDTAAGVETGMTGATVRSCEGCAFDDNSKSCICKTCYDYFN